MNGRSDASIAAQLGISRQAVSKYRRRVIHPALRTAAQLQSLHSGRPEPQLLTSEVNEVARNVIAASPFKERLHATWDFIDRNLRRAEHAVQIIDGDPVADDLAILAPLINQAHKNLELLGKASGELQDRPAAPSIAIQVVVPAGDYRPHLAQLDDSGVIDVGSHEIGSK